MDPADLPPRIAEVMGYRFATIGTGGMAGLCRTVGTSPYGGLQLLDVWVDVGPGAPQAGERRHFKHLPWIVVIAVGMLVMPLLHDSSPTG